MPDNWTSVAEMAKKYSDYAWEIIDEVDKIESLLKLADELENLENVTDKDSVATFIKKGLAESFTKITKDCPEWPEEKE